MKEFVYLLFNISAVFFFSTIWLVSQADAAFSELPAAPASCTSSVPGIINAAADYFLSSSDESAEAFARMALEEITSKWSVESYLELLHESVKTGLSPRDLEKTFFQFKKLGGLESVSSIVGNTTLTSDGLLGLYEATAHYEHGDAKITLKLLKDQNTWYVLYILVESSLFGSSVVVSDAVMTNLPPVSTHELIKLLDPPNLIKMRSIGDSVRLFLTSNVTNELDRATFLNVFRLYLQAIPQDMEMHILLAGYLSKTDDNEAEERRIHLSFVSRIAEDPILRERANKELGLVLPQRTATMSASNTNHVDVLLIPLGGFDRIMADEIAQTFMERTGLNVQIWSDTFPLPVPDKRLDEESITLAYSRITNSLTDLQVKEMKDAVSQKDELNINEMRALIELFFEKISTTPDLRRSFERNIGELTGLCGFKQVHLSGSLAERFPYIDGRASVYMALISEYLYDDGGADNMYGGSLGSYGVVSTFQFIDRRPDGIKNRPRLVDRMTKQLMSSVGTSLGIPRCYTPDCPRAFPGSVEEHDVKTPCLCDVCSRAFKRYKETGYNPEGSLNYLRKADQLQKNGAYLEAIPFAKVALNMQPDDWENYGYLIESHYMLGQFQTAMELCRMSKENLKGPRAYCFLAYTAGLSNDYIRANEVFEEAYQSFPGNIELLGEWLALLQKEGNRKKVQTLLAETISKLPESCKRYELIADGMVLLDKIDEAAAAYGRAIELGSSNALVYYAYAQCMENMNQLDKAEEGYRKSVETDSSASESLIRLARLIATSRDPAEALPYFRRAITDLPDNPDSYNDTGYTLFVLAKYDESMDVYNKGLLLFPQHALMHYNKALLLQKTGKLKEAVESYDESLRCGYQKIDFFESLKRQLDSTNNKNIPQ